MSAYQNNKKQKSARSNSEGSSNASSPSSEHMPGNNQVINNNNNAPKYGTLVPNRVFVGGIPSNTTEPELCQLFSKYGNVKATKIIADRAGVSKGYGFVTFETEEEAKRLQSDAENITLRERRLNIAPAVKKQPFSRVFENPTSPPPATNNLFFHNGIPYTYHNGMAYFTQTPNQGTPAVPTPPELPAVFQGSGFGPQNNAQTYGPTMMYPCNANPAAAMFIAPQPYNPYPHMPVPSQGPPPLMYPGGPNPSATQATNAPSDNSQAVQMPTGPPAPPYYLPPAMAQAPEIFYNMQPPPSQTCYTPMVSLASHENIVNYCDVMEQNSNGLNPEEQFTLPEGSLPNEVPLPSSHPESVNKCLEDSCKDIENSETPVVSLLSLQNEENCNDTNKITNSSDGAGMNRQPRLPYNGVRYTGRGRGTMLDGQRSYREQNSFNRGSSRGRGVKQVTYNLPVQHDNNNNHHNGVDKPGSPRNKTDCSVRGNNKVGPRGRGRGSTFFRGDKRSSGPPMLTSPVSQSLPFPSSINTRPPRPSHLHSQPHPNFKSGPFQIPPQIFHQRNFPNHYYHYPPVHQQPPPAPPTLPPPQNRRYGNAGKKPSNGSNTHMNSRKFKAEGMDSGAAGDAPVPLPPSSSPSTNNKNSSSSTQELCTQVQAMTL